MLLSFILPGYSVITADKTAEIILGEREGESRNSGNCWVCVPALLVNPRGEFLRASEGRAGSQRGCAVISFTGGGLFFAGCLFFFTLCVIFLLCVFFYCVCSFFTLCVVFLLCVIFLCAVFLLYVYFLLCVIFYV